MTSSAAPLTYDQAGVNYDLIDPLKITAQRAAAATASHLAGHGFSEVKASRGESAYVVDVGPFYIASIVECLGTKTLVADEMARLTGKSYFAGIAQDTIAMAVNDLITVGATPLVVQAYWAAGGSDWFGDAQRAQALVAGWKAACDTCQVAWGGGETPALAGIVEDGRIDLAASCTGLINPKERLSVGDRLGAGDAIVLLASSGIHANGLSLARKLAERLPNGYLTEIEPGLSYGEALLAPTALYSPVTEALWKAGIAPHYCANITGHGWRKLLRHPSALTYRIHTVPPKTAVLAFIQQQAGQDDREAYSTLNMGAGFAIFVKADDAERTAQIARDCGIEAWVAGTVEAGEKQLLIEPLGVRFSEDDLHLR
ncbi:MAG: phosphoribosylformylglycinamidine cyclo-ligase [Proteobacteria bacterium]|jgi:phosphoribosylformylglycinamidine cyclo-ligase|nr:phosphoribosylformylglycinamidine cyclo-ligase [Methylibium sp.]MBY0364735.1 phosphoribosylformylglycinamidine cyclo-ligase [Burkholderiaceae bacterium]MCH8855904.1 phosphoribosylformylglycinamidine cyclo-ligase [Pseudomonadota bacterium]|mmetsp:Transcript_30657/g.72027  ORF Transcript_30657/g.72027 Transcript_30657/m.72027 type:complete len:371 (+) Transcript_30657:788-1900(+)